jgi:hypothetical protein
MMMASVLQTKTQRTPFPVSPARASVPDSINRPLLIVGISIVLPITNNLFLDPSIRHRQTAAQ